MKTIDTNILLFEGKQIRKVWHENQWYFSLEDMIGVLTDSIDVKQYIKKIKLRDEFIFMNWGTLCTLVEMQTKDGKKRKIMCSNTESLLRIIQSVPSKKAEPIKQRLAKVGYERMQEINDPELGIIRSRENRKLHGRTDQWIQQRMMGQETRQKLTDYRKNHGIEQADHFAILTNIIHKERTEMNVQEHKKIKNLTTQNLRDHMSEAELLLTALAELSTRQIADRNQSTGFDDNAVAAKKGGTIAKNTRLALEEQTGKSVVTGQNLLS